MGVVEEFFLEVWVCPTLGDFVFGRGLWRAFDEGLVRGEFADDDEHFSDGGVSEVSFLRDSAEVFEVFEGVLTAEDIDGFVGGVEFSGEGVLPFLTEDFFGLLEGVLLGVEGVLVVFLTVFCIEIFEFIGLFLREALFLREKVELIFEVLVDGECVGHRVKSIGGGFASMKWGMFSECVCVFDGGSL